MNKRQKRGLIFLAVGVLLVLSGLVLHLTQVQEDTNAGKTAAILLQQLDNKKQPIGIQQGNGSHKDADPALPVKMYQNYALIGSISIPSVEIHLPVLDQWSEASLKVAPCRYKGTLSGNNMIIMGHNYKSHFNPLHKIQVGAEVTFENAVGKVYRYQVVKIEQLHRTAGELLPADYPLTLFTCTTGGLERVVVRCALITE